MKRLVLLLMLACGLMLSAQTYVGTMTFGSYTQKNVVARLTVKDGEATLLMERVKFSRFMPVKVDVMFDAIKVGYPVDADGNRLTTAPLTLTGEGIVPLSNGKRYEKYVVRQGRGTAGQRCDFSCMMGDKKVSYKGVRQQ